MNFDALADEDLLAIDPAVLEASLREQGWESQDLSIPAAIWMAPGERGERIFVPHDRTFDDYLPRLREALDAIRTVDEERWPALMVRLLAPLADVVRVRAAVATPADGSIGFNAGLRLIEGARGALEAATRAVVSDKSPTYGNKGWKHVRDYLSTARLGQTERGSYVVTVLSRLTLDGNLGPDVEPLVMLDVEPPVPFERRVAVLLAEAIDAARAASAEYLESSNFEAFQEAVGVGVSAELCTALASIR